MLNEEAPSAFQVVPSPRPPESSEATASSEKPLVPASILAKRALLCQDAVNLSGVVQTWARTVLELWSWAHKLGRGTTWVNNHPVNRLFASKVHTLSGMGLSDVAPFNEAYVWCSEASSEGDDATAEYVPKDKVMP